MKRILKRSLAIIVVLSCVLFLTPAGAVEEILTMVGMGTAHESPCQGTTAPERKPCEGTREIPAQREFHRPTRFAFPMI